MSKVCNRESCLIVNMICVANKNKIKRLIEPKKDKTKQEQQRGFSKHFTYNSMPKIGTQDYNV